jgi:stearoyl-CoA desaturase (delta-9 desaturase)
MTTALFNPALARPINNTLVWWFGAVHAIGILTVCYLIFVSCDWRIMAMAIALFFACHLSITMGPHRLWSHQAYKAHWILEAILVALSSATFQSSILWWAGQHRNHHAFSDTERDPYSVRHGFLWAHFMWMLHTSPEVPTSARSLLRNRLLLVQHRYYIWFATTFGLLLPATLGALIIETWWQGALEGLFVGGFMRVMMQCHLTWVINSVAHTFGWRRYPESGTARTNGWLGLFTVGESYHERHHLADKDYRLGNRSFDIDPGKWLIWASSKIWLASELVTISESEVKRRAEALARG